MSVSSRRQRVRIYSYSNVGSEGEVGSAYTFVAERWGHVMPTGGRESTGFGTTGHSIDAIILLPDDVTVTDDGLLAHGDDRYFVRSVIPRRKRRELEVLGQRVADAVLDVRDA